MDINKPFLTESKLETIKSILPEAQSDSIISFVEVMHLAHQLLITFDLYFNQYGLSSGRFFLLAELLSNERLDKTVGPVEIARQLRVKTATVTGMLNSLERDGYVERTRDENDRRRVIASITPTGRQAVQSFLPYHIQNVVDIVQGIDSGSRETTRQTLHQLLKRIENKIDCNRSDFISKPSELLDMLLKDGRFEPLSFDRKE